jgi:gluconokinase
MAQSYPTIIPGLRSPFEQVNGLVYFGRMLDKIRLAAAGKLPEGWEELRGAKVKGSLDWRCCQFLKIDYAALEAETLKGGQTDAELLAWAFQHGRHPDDQEIEVWNAFMTKRGWRDSGTQRLHERLAEIGLPPGTVLTMFEFIDLDEGRLTFAQSDRALKPIDGHFLIKPEDLAWRPANIMKIPNADFLERTGSEIMGARFWRLPPNSANTLHKHVRAEEFYFVVEGVGRIRVEDETLTVPKHGGLLVGPKQLRQVFNDTESDVLWLIVGAPEELEFLPGAQPKADLSLIYPVDPKQMPKELAGVEWPPKT